MNIKKALRDNKFIFNHYMKMKKNRQIREMEDGLKYNGKFVNRSKGQKKLCIMLTGYKEFCYEAVFGRLERYMDEDIDVCLITSGKYSDKVAAVCEKNGWSYLSTVENNVSLVQNVAINLHPNAEYIYKLDEDIFLTEGYFRKLFAAYQDAASKYYNPGVLAPILPINGFGHMAVLKEYGLLDVYEEKFERPCYGTLAHRMTETSPEVAEFFWGEGGYVPGIDEMNAHFAEKPMEEIPCSFKFSIGAILFTRQLWEKMGHFKVNRSNNAMGADETQLCTYCNIYSRPLMVSMNTVVGHLSYGKQNAAMKAYYEKHPEKFM